MTTTLTSLDGADIRLRHDVAEDKVRRIAESMDASGWVGRPVVVYQDDEGRLYNITGCHRISAAIVADIEVPALLIDASDDETLDIVEYAAALEDPEAADTLRKHGFADAADVVEQG